MTCDDRGCNLILIIYYWRRKGKTGEGSRLKQWPKKNAACTVKHTLKIFSGVPHKCHTQVFEPHEGT